MARIVPPAPYTTWNAYTNAMVKLAPDQSIAGRRLTKRNIKLEEIAAVERFANGVTTNPRYRPYHLYETPGTFSPATAHPWLTELTDSLGEILLENGIDTLSTENLYEITAEGPVDTPYDPTPTQRSLSFNNVANNYVEVGGTTSDWALGTTWTIEYWVKPSTITVNGGPQLFTVMCQDLSGGIEIYHQSGKFCIHNSATTLNEPTVNVWTHVALVNKPSGLTVYYNGTSVLTTGSYGLSNSSRLLTIGRRGNNNFQYFPGKLTNIRISNIDRYSSTFTPSRTLEIDANVKLALDGGLVDTSASAHTITNNGASVDTDFPT